MTDREACMSGALMRACFLIRKGWNDQDIIDRIARDYLQLSARQRAMVVALAHAGVNAANAIDWTDPTATVDVSQFPQLPP